MSWEQQSGNLHTNPGNRTPTTEDQIWPSTTFTSDWTFSLGPKAPVFPQSYSGYPVTNAGSTAVTSTAENPFEMSFGDVSIWDEWDSFEGYSSVANAPSRISPNESNESPFFPGVGQLAAESGRLLTTPPLFATLNQTVSPPIFAEPELPMTNQGPWFSVSSSAPGPGSRSPSTTVSPNPRVSSSVQNLSNKSPPSRKNATKSSRNSVKRPNVRRASTSLTSPKSSHQSVPTRYRTTNAAISADPYPTPASTERSATSPQSTSATSRGLTEQKYRARVNDQFTTLLGSIPKELVNGSSEYIGRIHPEKPVSKIEVLDLAQKHINMLERQQAELKEESIKLKGQVELFQRVFVGMGGQVMP